MLESAPSSLGFSETEPRPTHLSVNGGSGPPKKRTSPATQVLALIALVLLCAFIVQYGQILWEEWSLLRHQHARIRNTIAIGYPGITPAFSRANYPQPWIKQEGDSTLIWSGWKHGHGHQWFRVVQGDVDPTLISAPIGRNVIRAIDVPIVEQAGGTIWNRIPDEAIVVGHRFSGVDSVYPVLVLDKVFVVNDTIGGKPYLIATSPSANEPGKVAVYEPVVEGQRLTMGLTGYFLAGQPLLYDRATESLWIAHADSLRAISGSHKGRELREFARPERVAWGRWRSEHPGSRLVVGAHRPSM